MFVKVHGTLEPDAIAAAISRDMLDRTARMVVDTINHHAEDGCELDPIQMHGLVVEALSSFDGTEVQIRAELDRAIEWANRDVTARVGGHDA